MKMLSGFSRRGIRVLGWIGLSAAVTAIAPGSASATEIADLHCKILYNDGSLPQAVEADLKPMPQLVPNAIGVDVPGYNVRVSIVPSSDVLQFYIKTLFMDGSSVNLHSPIPDSKAPKISLEYNRAYGSAEFVALRCVHLKFTTMEKAGY
ncbi:MAG: hypothetical protein JNL01_00030 [Bdellovibrionales bacterium]|nr:hypothetical protein [Bdellovibrionales bacterium]